MNDRKKITAGLAVLAMLAAAPAAAAQGAAASPSTAQGTTPSPATTASRSADSLAAIALADTALALISRRDFAGLADLMLPEARTFSSRFSEGEWRYASRSREEQRTSTLAGTISERGFGATALVSGPLAVVWMPYDLYRNGAWSHCGVDALTMYKVGTQWRIATFAWTVEQPPACSKHPNGPPPQ